LIPFYHPANLGEWFPPGKSKKSWRAGLSGGTTLIACEILNRVCRAIEIDPGYVAASLERWHLMTGEMPEQKSPTQ
jgi:hypothetical protein